MVRVFKHWEHYLVHKQFILHQSLQFLNSKKCLSSMHARWALFLQKFNFIFNHKGGEQNIVADALSRRTCVLTIIKNKVTSFESFNDLYQVDGD